MNCKIFSVSIVFGITLLPYCSFSQGIYIGGQYKPAVSVLRDFSAQETISGLTKSIHGLSTEEKILDIKDGKSFTIQYDPAYDNSMLGFSGILGYSIKNVRVEIEGAFESFATSKQFYSIDENHQYFALSRDSDKYDDFVVLKNDKVENYSILVNVCYDLSMKEVLYPYICGGTGLENVSLLQVNTPKFAYQAKFGINYRVSDRVTFFGGGYYRSLIGAKYNRIPVFLSVIKKDPMDTDVSVKLKVAYFGWETGLRLMF